MFTRPKKTPRTDSDVDLMERIEKIKPLTTRKFDHEEKKNELPEMLIDEKKIPPPIDLELNDVKSKTPQSNDTVAELNSHTSKTKDRLQFLLDQLQNNIFDILGTIDKVNN